MVVRLSPKPKQFLLIVLNNLRSQKKSITLQIKLRVCSKHGFWLHTRKSFVASLDDLGNISVLLGKDNDWREITHLFTESYFHFQVWQKITTNKALNILKTCTVIRDNFERFQMFSSTATVWFGLETQFSQLIKGQWYSVNAVLAFKEKCL